MILGEPQLGKRGLYPNTSTKKSHNEVKDLMNLISYSDGKKSLLEIANEIKVPIWDLSLLARKLIEHKILKKV